jgi:WD40 repeat protein
MIAVGTIEGRVLLFDEVTGHMKWDICAHSQDKYSDKHYSYDGRNFTSVSVEMSPNMGEFVASIGDDDDQWKLWDVGTGALKHIGRTHDGLGGCTCETKEARISRTVNTEHDIGYVQKRTPNPIIRDGCPIIAHIGKMSALTFSHDGARLATSDCNGAVIIWDIATGDAVVQMQHGGGIPSIHGNPWGGSTCNLAFSHDGMRLADDSRVWNSVTGESLYQREPSLDGWHERIQQFSPNDSSIIVLRACANAMNNALEFFNIDTNMVIRQIECGFAATQLSHDWRYLFTDLLHKPAVVDITNLPSMTMQQLVLFPHSELQGVVPWTRLQIGCFSADGRKVVACDERGYCHIWDSESGTKIRTLDVCSTADDTMITSVSWGHDWVRCTDRKIAVLMGHHDSLGRNSLFKSLDPALMRWMFDTHPEIFH